MALQLLYNLQRLALNSTLALKNVKLGHHSFKYAAYPTGHQIII